MSDSRTDLPLVHRCLRSTRQRSESLKFRPLLILGPGRSSLVHFTGSRYFWTATTRGPNRTTVELGWIDPREIMDRSESAALVIEGQFVMERRDETYMVTKPVYETLEQGYTVIVRRLVDGQWRLVPEVRIRRVQVMRMVPEQRIRTVNVQRLALSAVARAGGEALISEVTFRTLVDGAFVRYHLAGRDRVHTAPNPTTSTQDCDFVVYMLERTNAGPLRVNPGDVLGSLKRLKKEHLVEFLKQRGWHAEAAYTGNDGTARQVAVWGPRHSDRQFHEGDTKFAIMHIFHPEFPGVDAERLAGLKGEIRRWKEIFNKHRFPENGDLYTGSHKYLDPADFTTPDELAAIAVRLIDRPPNEEPKIGSVTCVQWSYQTVCLALNFHLNRHTLKELGVFDSYEKHWMPRLGAASEDLRGLNMLPFMAYSPAEVLQESLNTYAPGHRLVDLLRTHDDLGLVPGALLSSVELPGFVEHVPGYLHRVAETGDISLPFDVQGHAVRFVMPIAFYCENRRASSLDANAPWFRYIATAVHESCVTRKG